MTSIARTSSHVDAIKNVKCNRRVFSNKFHFFDVTSLRERALCKWPHLIGRCLPEKDRVFFRCFCAPRWARRCPSRNGLRLSVSEELQKKTRLSAPLVRFCYNCHSYCVKNLVWTLQERLGTSSRVKNANTFVVFPLHFQLGLPQMCLTFPSSCSNNAQFCCAAESNRIR